MEQENILKNIKLKNKCLSIVKALIISLSVTMVCIFLFAVILKFLDVSTKTILTVNQIIKIASILIACIVFNKKQKINWLSGLLIGLLYAITTYVIFSLLANSFNMDVSFLYNIIFSSLIGLICGFIVKGMKQR